jgi:hypothetical protein
VGQVVAVRGGPRVASKIACQGSCHGHAVGRCIVMRRAEVAILAGMLMMRRRIVAVVALAWLPPATVPAARVRLNAMTARTSHAALALNLPDGRWARAEPKRRRRPAR